MHNLTPLGYLIVFVGGPVIVGVLSGIAFGILGTIMCWPGFPGCPH